jgi:hypothetical protein
MHPPPGPPHLPEGIRSARQVGSRLPVAPAKRWGHVASFDETLPRSTAPYRTPVQAPESGVESTVRRPLHRRAAHAGVATFASVASRRPSLRSDSTSPGLEPRVTTQPSLSTLSVGYTSVVDGCPPATPVRQRRQNRNHFRFAARMRGSVGLGQDSTATSPPRSRSSQTLPSRRPEYLRNAEHTVVDLTSNAVRFRRCTSRIPRDPVGARSLAARYRWKRPTPL